MGVSGQPDHLLPDTLVPMDIQRVGLYHTVSWNRFEFHRYRSSSQFVVERCAERQLLQALRRRRRRKDASATRTKISNNRRRIRRASRRRSRLPLVRHRTRLRPATSLRRGGRLSAGVQHPPPRGRRSVRTAPARHLPTPERLLRPRRSEVERVGSRRRRRDRRLLRERLCRPIPDGRRLGQIQPVGGANDLYARLADVRQQLEVFHKSGRARMAVEDELGTCENSEGVQRREQYRRNRETVNMFYVEGVRLHNYHWC